MNKTDDATAIVDDWKMLVARMIEAVKGKWTKYFVVTNISNSGFGEHDFMDTDVWKIHNGGNNMTLART